MSIWAHIRRSMSKFFSRGSCRTLLAKAYHEHGIKTCPRILAPLSVRMVVYCGQYISQSMRHHVARARAVMFATGRLRRLCDQKHLKISKQGKDSMSKLCRVQAAGQVLWSNIAAPLACE